MKKTSHVGESVTSAALHLSPRQLHNLLTQMPLKNFAIAFNQGLNLQKKDTTVSSSWSKSPSIDRRHDAASWQRRHLKVEAQQVPFRRRSPGSIFAAAGGGHFELPHARALQAAAVELKELRSRPQTVGNVGKYQNGTSYTRVSARHNWDASAPLWVSFSKRLWAKNVLSPSGFSTFCGSWEQYLQLSMASVSLPFS